MSQNAALQLSRKCVKEYVCNGGCSLIFIISWVVTMKSNQGFRRLSPYHKHCNAQFFHCEQLVLAMPVQYDVVGGCIGWSKVMFRSSLLAEGSHCFGSAKKQNHPTWWSCGILFDPCHTTAFILLVNNYYYLGANVMKQEERELKIGLWKRMWHSDVAATQWRNCLQPMPWQEGPDGSR